MLARSSWKSRQQNVSSNSESTSGQACITYLTERKEYSIQRHQQLIKRQPAAKIGNCSLSSSFNKSEALILGRYQSIRMNSPEAVRSEQRGQRPTQTKNLSRKIREINSSIQEDREPIIGNQIESLTKRKYDNPLPYSTSMSKD